MINFRYHVVSLTAVFLALAIGLVVGTAALNGQWADSLNDQVRSLGADNQRLRDQVSHLNEDVNSKEEFATDAAPLILADKLAGQQVLLVSMSSVSRYAAGVRQMVTTAGAKVTGEVEIMDKFTEPKNNETLLDIASTAAVANVNLPTNSDGVETSTALLAQVLVSPQRAPGTGGAGSPAKTVLAAYTQGGFIRETAQVTGPATAIIFIAAPPYTDRESSRRNMSVTRMVDQFDKAAPLVVAADGTAGKENIVSTMRGDPTLSKTVSTVDNVATVQGQVATALVCAEQLAGKAGHYGIGDGASSIIPKKQNQ